MSVVIAYEEAGPWRKRLTIEVPAPAVEAETGRVVKALGKSVQLPGFRKGKVPSSLIQKRFPEEVERRVAEALVPRYLHQAEAEKNLDPLTEPQVEDLTFDPGKAMTFIALVETRPEIELGNVDEFTLPEGDPEPTEDEIEDALRDLRRQQADWRTVERPAAAGDLVLGDVVETPDAAASEVVETPDAAAPEEKAGAGEPRPLRIEIGAEGVDEELSLALTGFGAGQRTTFHRTLGEGAEARRQEYRIEVKSVEERVLPELDDAFAAKVGEFADVSELTDAVRARLGASKRADLQKRREQAALEQLRQRHPLELPEGVVDQEVNQILNQQASRLAAQGVDVDKAPIDWESLASQVRPDAQKRAHDRLLLDAIAKTRGIKLDEARFERFLADLARSEGKTSLALRQELSSRGRLNGLRAQLLERQTLRQLLGDEAGGGEDGGGEDGGGAEGAGETADHPDDASREEA